MPSPKHFQGKLTKDANSQRIPFLLLAAITAFFLGVAAAYRLFGEGVDYLSYKEAYEELAISGSADSVRFENGFANLALISNYIGINFDLFFIANVSISLYLKILVFSRYPRPTITFILYFFCFYFLHEYSQIRMAMSLSICFIALDFLFKKNYFLFLLFIFFASLFHYAAILTGFVFIFAYYFSKFHLIYSIIIVFILSIFSFYGDAYSYVGVIFDLTKNEFFDEYGYKRVDINVFSGLNILSFLAFFTILLNIDKMTMREKTLFITCISGFVFFIIFQNQPVMAHRLKEMFLVFLVPLMFRAEPSLRTSPQYVVGAALGGWMLYTYWELGIIGGGV